MSKGTSSNQFRKVDVDAFDDEKFVDDEIANEHTDSPSEGDIQNLLNSKKNTEALRLLIGNPVLAAGLDAEKKAHFALVMRVLTQFKSSEMEATVKQLSEREVDVLMKYIYRGFSEPSEKTCGTLLQWHEKTAAVGGVGSIVRVMTDRKNV